MTIPRFAADVDPATLAAALHERVCAIFESLAAPDHCDQVEA